MSFIKNIDNVSHTINELPDHGDHLHFNMSNLFFFSLFYQLLPAIVAKIELDDNISKKQHVSLTTISGGNTNLR